MNFDFLSQRPTFVFFEWSKFDEMWFYLRQRPQHMARALVKLGWQVLFIEPPSPVGRDTLQVVSVGPHMFRVEPWAFATETIDRCVEQLHSVVPEATWLIHHPNWMPLLREHLQRAQRVIYDCMDYWVEFPGGGTALHRMEIELATKADLVLASAFSLYTRMKKCNPNTLYVSNAVNEDDYADVLPEADDLRSISGPRMLVVGYFGRWVDLDLIQFLARSRPDWSFVLVGPTEVSFNRLPQADNLFWLGKKPYESLGAYMHHCDVGLIPFKQTRLTCAVNPLKVHEYVACGLPVVSTFLPELLLFDDPAVKVTATYEQFLAALDDVVQNQPTPCGARGIQSGTWQEKMDILTVSLASPAQRTDDSSLHQYVDALSRISDDGLADGIAEELALAYYILGDWQAAANTNTADINLRRAALVRTGRFDEALALSAPMWTKEAFSRFFENDRPIPDLVTAYAFLENDELRRALDVLHGTSRSPLHSLLLGRLYAALGWFKESLDVFAQVVEQQFSLLQPYDFITIGDLCRETGLLDKAEEFYLHAGSLGLQEEVSQKLSNLYFTQSWGPA